MENSDFYPKVSLTKVQRMTNSRIFWRVVEAIILPAFISILLGIEHGITITIALLWWSVGIYGLFVDKELFITQIILMFFGIIGENK
jgi:hypothetical protein